MAWATLKAVYTLQAILTQLLSNLISPVNSSARAQNRSDQCLQLYLSGKREDDVIMYAITSNMGFMLKCRRLLDSAEPRVNRTTIHLLSNLIRDTPSRLCVHLPR